MKKKFITAMAALLMLSMTACRTDYTKEGGLITTADLESLNTATETTVVTEEVTTAELVSNTVNNVNETRLLIDREGMLIEIPAEINSIVSLSPSVTEILSGLGVGGKIIGADTGSNGIVGVNSSLCTIDPNLQKAEEIAALDADVIFVSGTLSADAPAYYETLKSLGENVVYIPTATSLAGIKLDIEFISEYVSAKEKGVEMIDDIDAAIADISSKAAAVKRKVYVELAPEPSLKSCGADTFINEIITLTGAENIYTESGWLSNTEDTVIAANPDVIITATAYEGYDYVEISSRANWRDIPAVKVGNVHQVSTAVVRPSQNIVDGMYEIAAAIYPEIFSVV